MERYYDELFGSLNRQILEMGDAVERAIDCAIEGLKTRSAEAFQRVHAFEKTINQFHMNVDEVCMRVLARQAPRATDLRFVLGCLKINSDLERMGDQAVNIAYCATGRGGGECIDVSSAPDVLVMAETVRRMTHRTLEAFVRRDVEIARQVLREDDAVDAFKNSIFHSLVHVMKEDSSRVDRSMNLILVARNLERIGDHATNIAEDVIFVASGVDIRHGATRQSS